jgi:hypothetical protein
MFIAGEGNPCESRRMKTLALILVAPALGGCAVGAIASTAVDVATVPVKVAKTGVNAVSAGVDAVTTSQSEADEKRGREARKEDERRGREARLAAERCRNGKPLPADDCSAFARPD